MEVNTEEKASGLNTSRLNQLRTKLRPLTLVVYTCSLILGVLNSTGVTFAVADIARRYAISENEASWALSAYALTFGAFLLISGRLGISLFPF